MSKKVEAAGAGSPEGLSEAVQDGQSAAAMQLMMHIVRTAISPQNVLKPEAQIQIDLRKDDTRSELLEQLILEVAPNGVDPDLWIQWLRGGKHGFPTKLKKVGPGEERPAQTLIRTPPRVRTQQKKVDRLRSELEEEERQLNYLRAHQNAAVHWHVVDQLVAIMAPMFAMGPAWTLMRSVTGHMSDEEADRLTRVLTGKEKAEAIVEYRRKHQDESDEILEALDLFSGHEGFERALRIAIKKVIKDHDSKREAWIQSGRRRRSKSAQQETAHPEAQNDRDEVLAGLKRRA